MKAYVYRAALLCEDCANTVKLERSAFASSEDSNEYPQGPYGDGGGEADSPQHCDHCQIFLENPLTNDGIAYVRKQIEEKKNALSLYLTTDGNIIDKWREFYGL